MVPLKTALEDDTPNVDVLVFERDGVQVVSDVLTLEMINGSNIEYKEEMIRSSFEVVGNP